MTMGQVLEKSEEELLSLRNFGRKSYDELRDKLNEMGLLAADSPEDVMEALPIEEGETPIIAARPAVEEAAAPEAAPAEEEATVATEAAAPAKRSRAKKAAATEEEEEVPEWQRKLKELIQEEPGE
jgi:hypothetical protein